MRISDWSSDVCSSDLSCICRIGDRHRPRCVACSQSVDIVSRNRTEKPGCGLLKTGHIEHHRGSCPLHQCRRSGCGVDRSVREWATGYSPVAKAQYKRMGAEAQRWEERSGGKEGGST